MKLRCARPAYTFAPNVLTLHIHSSPYLEGISISIFRIAHFGFFSAFLRLFFCSRLPFLRLFFWSFLRWRNLVRSMTRRNLQMCGCNCMRIENLLQIEPVVLRIENLNSLTGRYNSYPSFSSEWQCFFHYCLSFLPLLALVAFASHRPVWFHGWFHDHLILRRRTRNQVGLPLDSLSLLLPIHRVTTEIPSAAMPLLTATKNWFNIFRCQRHSITHAPGAFLNLELWI